MGALNIKKNYLTKNRCYKQGQTRKPIGIQIHSIGCAQGTAQAVADYWNSSSVSACVTYIVDADVAGKVLQTLPEEYYTWADGGYGNRNLITIEVCESDFMRYISGASYNITSKDLFESDVIRGYENAVVLCADICKRYGWDPLKKLDSGLYLISSHDEGRIAGLSTAHVDPSHLWPRVGLNMDTFRKAVATCIKHNTVTVDTASEHLYRVRTSWKDQESQLGAYFSLENAKNACPFGYSVFDENGTVIFQNTEQQLGTQAKEFEGLTETAAAKRILELVHATDKSGIFNSVTSAQMILESGYVKTELAKIANNCFGMKKELSGNTWDSVWDGKSTAKVSTWENYDGHDVTIYAEFRKYPNIETSIMDHAAYLLGAKNGSNLRYDGLLKAKDYKEAVTIVKTGGYATDPNYISKICSIIQRFGLDKYDKAPEVNTKYMVQIGSYKLKRNAEAKMAAVKDKTKINTTMQLIDGQYVIFAGKFKQRKGAERRVKLLRETYEIDAFVKEL